MADPRRLLRASGIAAVAAVAASVLAVVPPLWLCAVAGGASDSTLHALARASDLTDVLVFLAIGAFSGVVAVGLDERGAGCWERSASSRRSRRETAVAGAGAADGAAWTEVAARPGVR